MLPNGAVSLWKLCMRSHITVWSDCILNWWRQGPQSPVTLRKLRPRRPPAGGDSQTCLKGEWKGTHRGYSRALQILPERGGTESAVDVRDRKDYVWTQRIQGEITLDSAHLHCTHFSIGLDAVPCTRASLIPTAFPPLRKHFTCHGPALWHLMDSEWVFWQFSLCPALLSLCSLVVQILPKRDQSLMNFCIPSVHNTPQPNACPL